MSLDALTYAGNLDNLEEVLSHERLSFVHGDIRDAELVRKVVAEDVIVNAAASARREVDRGGRVRVRDDERRGRRSCSTRCGPPVERFILISSSEVYGTARATPWTRTTRSTRGPYAATKAGADRLAYSYFVTYDLPIVILRPFNNYGRASTRRRSSRSSSRARSRTAR